MIIVVIDDLIPEIAADSNPEKKSRLPIIGFLIGFILMMSLDVGLA